MWYTAASVNVAVVHSMVFAGKVRQACQAKNEARQEIKTAVVYCMRCSMGASEKPKDVMGRRGSKLARAKSEARQEMKTAIVYGVRCTMRCSGSKAKQCHLI